MRTSIEFIVIAKKLYQNKKNEYLEELNLFTYKTNRERYLESIL